MKKELPPQEYLKEGVTSNVALKNWSKIAENN